MELKEDFAANNMLRCERAAALLMNKKARDKLSQEELEKRLVGAWDSDCAYEGPDDMFDLARATYKFQKLYTKDGKPVDVDDDKEADICELIRSLIYSGKIGTINTLKDISGEDFDRTTAQISCPGPLGLEVCAGTDNFPGDFSGWYTFIRGDSIQINNLPN